jgi:DnaK suppressor protein
MDASHLDTFKRELETLRAELLAQIAQQRGGVQSRADVAAEHFAHSEDAPAQVATERDVEFALNERETAELHGLDCALARIASGTFGQCTDCQAAIPPARLQATPEAARCIPCQEKAEH